MVSNKKILEKYSKEYDFIYNSEENRSSVAGTRDAVEYFDMSMAHNPKFKNKICELATEMNDFFSSDRECAAIVFAMDSLGVLDELER